MNFPKAITVYKKRFDTPLEALIQARFDYGIPAEIPMCYAGRLDPMAVGQMLVLVGDECKERDKYLGRDKVYKLEILFGISTDTHDVFGIIDAPIKVLSEEESVACMIAAKTEVPHFVGTHTFSYPKFSTKGLLTAEETMPMRDMTIHNIRFDGGKMISGLYAKALLAEAIEKIEGDFRYEEIADSWQLVPDDAEFPVIKLEVACAAGAYMRTLALELGKKLGVPALAYYIERIQT